jgi:hypothetical protein
MAGFIRRRDIIRHSILVIHLFGWRVYWRCLTSRTGTTFLSIAMEVKQ